MQVDALEERVCTKVLCQHHVPGFERANILEKEDKMAPSIENNESMERLHGLQEVYLPLEHLRIYVLES